MTVILHLHELQKVMIKRLPNIVTLGLAMKSGGAYISITGTEEEMKNFINDVNAAYNMLFGEDASESSEVVNQK